MIYSSLYNGYSYTFVFLPPQIKKIIIMEKETTLTLIHTVWCGITFLQYKEQSTGTKGLNQSWYPMNDFWVDVMSLMISGKDLVMDRLDQSGVPYNNKPLCKQSLFQNKWYNRTWNSVFLNESQAVTRRNTTTECFANVSCDMKWASSY